MTIYRSFSGVNRVISSQYRGISGVNRNINSQYRGVSGVNRLVFNRGTNILNNVQPFPGSYISNKVNPTLSNGIWTLNPGNYQFSSFSSIVTSNNYTVSTGQKINVSLKNIYQITAGTQYNLIIYYTSNTADYSNSFEVLVHNSAHSANEYFEISYTSTININNMRIGVSLFNGSTGLPIAMEVLNFYII